MQENMNEYEKIIVDKIKEVSTIFPFKDYITPDKANSCLALAQTVFSIIGRFSGKLLDIGSGPMNKTAVFSLLGFECYAVDDLSDPWHKKDDNINKIKEFASIVNINFCLQDHNDYTIPFDKNIFDIVMINDVIEHLHESPRNLLNTAFEFAKTGGLIVVTMPNAVNLRKRLSVLLGKTNYPDISGFYSSAGTWRGHVREYTLAETIYILQETGGEIVHADTFHANIFAKINNSLIRKIYNLLTVIVPTLRDGIIVIARKPPDWGPREYSEEKYWHAISSKIPRGVNPLSLNMK